MSSPPKTYPYQDVTTTVKQDPFFQQMVWGSKNAPGRLLMKDASRRGQMMAGVQQGDPKALEQFFGYKPTKQDYAALGSAQGSSGSYIRKFDPASGQYRNVVNPDYTPAPIPKVALKDDVPRAARGGIMSLQRFAPGGTTNKSAPKKKEKTPPPPKLERPKADDKTAFTDAEQKKYDQLNKLRNSGKPMTQDQIKRYNAMVQQDKQYKELAAKPNPDAPINKSPMTPDQALGASTPFVDPNTLMTTNPYYQNAVNTIANSKEPAAYGQATDAYKDASTGLKSFANYTPSQVSSSSINPMSIAAERASAAQMGSIANIAAERAAAAKMGSIADVKTKPLEYFQMDAQGNPHVSTKALEAFQMNGPGSWTDEGVQQRYMNPYIQGVIDVSKRQKARDYAQQVNDINANSISKGAFGGARQALQTANAARDYQQQLQDMEIQGLSQAYQQGQGQWTNEMTAAQQAAMQNLQSKLSTQSQYSSQDLQAQLANQGIDYQTAVQNLQAKLGVQAAEADQMLRAALANQQTQFGVGSLNAQNEQASNLANMQAALQASMANQQTQFGVGSLNANLSNQTNLANAQNALQASLGNQNTSLAAQQANQRAAIEAMIANQNAGLAANSQGINAYGQMGSNASGLAGVGNAQAAYNQQQIQNWANAGDVTQNNAQNWLNSQANRANNLYNGVPNVVNPAINAAQTNPQGGSTNVNGQAPSPLSR